MSYPPVKIPLGARRKRSPAHLIEIHSFVDRAALDDLTCIELLDKRGVPFNGHRIECHPDAIPSIIAALRQHYYGLGPLGLMALAQEDAQEAQQCRTEA